MPAISRENGILTIGDSIRIEPGPAKLTAVATKELLGDATAAHYQPPRKASKAEIADPAIDTPDGMVFSKDAHGDPIQLDQEFTYLDWNAHRAGESVYYLSQLEPLTAKECEDRGCELGESIWRDKGVFPNEDAAISAAYDLIGGA